MIVTETVTISELGAQGDGVTDQGVFVPGTLPGESARVNITGHRATLLEIVETAPERIQPICPHFGSCGGCALQHAGDGFLAAWKRDLIDRALAARGIDGIEVAETITSPPASRRRITFGGRRTKKDVVIGFHAPASDQLVAIEECAVARPQIIGALPILERLIVAGASRKGEVKLVITTSEAGLDIAATGGKPMDGGLYGQLVAATAASDIARLTWDGEPVISRDPPTQTMGRARVVPPPGGFLQATEEGEAALVAAVRRAVGDAGSIADLFAGSGTFTLPLAERAEVLAIETQAEALEALDAGWRQAPDLKRVTTEVRDLFRRPLLARELDGTDAVVIDPPRQGARAQCEQIALSGVGRVAAVSCNPATFARDARILIDAGFALDWVQPVDQFRWNPHVELAAAFSRG